MAMKFDAIEKQALGLSMQDRASLAERLLASLDDVSVAEAEQLWLEVAARRATEIDTGRVTLVSAEELEDRIEARLK